MFHTHQWNEIARTYAPPNPNLTPKQYSEDTAPLVHGSTTIVWTCKLCPLLRKEVLLGKEVEKKI